MFYSLNFLVVIINYYFQRREGSPLLRNPVTGASVVPTSVGVAETEKASSEDSKLTDKSKPSGSAVDMDKDKPEDTDPDAKKKEKQSKKEFYNNKLVFRLYSRTAVP